MIWIKNSFCKVNKYYNPLMGSIKHSNNKVFLIENLKYLSFMRKMWTEMWRKWDVTKMSLNNHQIGLKTVDV